MVGPSPDRARSDSDQSKRGRRRAFASIQFGRGGIEGFPAAGTRPASARGGRRLARARARLSLSRATRAGLLILLRWGAGDPVWEGGTPNSRRDGWCWCWCFGAPSRAARWWWPGRPCFSFWVLVSVLVPDPVRRGRAWARVWRANGRRRGARACGGVGRKFGVEWSGVVTTPVVSSAASLRLLVPGPGMLSATSRLLLLADQGRVYLHCLEIWCWIIVF